MKGQQQVLTSLLLIIIMIAVVGSVYFWGMPLIQKNRDVTVLRKAEDFMFNLNNKIKYVANTQTKDSIKIDVGTVSFDPSTETITLEVNTKGTVYAVGAPVYFVRNASDVGVWGRDEPELIYVEAIDTGGGYHHVYTLKYRELVMKGLGKSEIKYKISLVSDISGKQYGSSGHIIFIEYKGTETIQQGTTSVTLTKVGLKIE